MYRPQIHKPHSKLLLLSVNVGTGEPCFTVDTVTTTRLNTSHNLSTVKIIMVYILTLFTDLRMSIKCNGKEKKTGRYEALVHNLSHTLKDKLSQ